MDAATQNVIKANLTEEEAAKVIAALEAAAVEQGVGTVLHNPATGDVALRVGQYGEFYWRIYATDDRTWIEKEPLVGWDVLHKAAAPVVAPAQVDPAEEPAATPKKK